MVAKRYARPLETKGGAGTEEGDGAKGVDGDTGAGCNGRAVGRAMWNKDDEEAAASPVFKEEVEEGDGEVDSGR